MNSNQLLNLLIEGSIDTLLMTLVASVIAFILGGGLGIVLVLTKQGGLKQNPLIYRVLDVIVNLMRSIPFVILMLFIMPLTKLLVQTTIGIWPTTVALTVAAIPFVARLVENVLSEVDSNLIEMAHSLGAKPHQILWEVILNESWPALIRNGAIAMVTILGYGAMAGFTGGGGLGVIAINYGYYRNQTLIMVLSILCMILMVQSIEYLGNKWSLKINQKHR